MLPNRVVSPGGGPVSPNDMTTEYAITRLGHQGDGVADGPVFAPRTLPGDVVTGTLNGSRLSDVRIVTPSKDRVRPACRHYKACGGCQLQHASDGFVANWKTEFVKSALAAQGIETSWRPISVSPPNSRRRATIAARRTKKGAIAGFHGQASGTISDISDCRLLDPDLVAAIPVAQGLAVVAASRKGELHVTLTKSLGGLDVSVTGGKPLDGPLQSALAQFAGSENVARLAWDGDVVAQRLPPEKRFGTAHVVPPPGAFLQATPQGESALVSAVQDAVGHAKRVADLFSGCGTFTLPLAVHAEIHAVEGDSAMIQALDRGWRMSQGMKLVTTETRDLFRRPLLADELARFDAAVLDPPRAGAEAQTAELARSGVRQIAYVSCNPVTFARDARVLCDAGYRLAWVQVVDQFRWSVHTELAAAFELAA